MDSNKIVGLDGVWYSQAEFMDRADFELSSDITSYRKSFWLFIKEWFNSSSTIEVKTSGSTGVPKSIQLSKDKMVASAKRTVEFLDIKVGGNALICLSCDYIAGKMMVVRSLTNRMNIILVEPSSNPLNLINEFIDFAALVPMQVLYYQNSPSLLNQIDTMIVGGAAVSEKVAYVLDLSSVKAFETYGMTETISHIALRRINGDCKDRYFTPLKGVNIELNSEGALVISDDVTLDDVITTNDLAEITQDSHFTIKGRADNIINSGGVKISPEEVERIIAPLLPMEFAISWKVDARLGQKMVLVVESLVDTDLLVKINALLSKYQQINECVVLEHFPKTETNKLNRVVLHQQIK